MSGFVRKDFYVEPPNKDSTPDEWREWLRADNQKARAAKASHTRKLHVSASDLPDTAAIMVKRDGRWTQSCAIGFGGDFASGNGSLEAIDEGSQEHIITTPWVQSKRGTKSRNRNLRRAKAKKARHK